MTEHGVMRLGGILVCLMSSFFFLEPLFSSSSYYHLQLESLYSTNAMEPTLGLAIRDSPVFFLPLFPFVQLSFYIST